MKFLVFAKYRTGEHPLQAWSGYEVHPLSDFKQVFDLAIKAFGA